MPPKKKHQPPRKELTAEDMRRLGMSEEDISRLLAERGKSSAERQQEQAAAEAHRRAMEQRQRRQREWERAVESLEKAEGTPRAAIRAAEETAWEALKETLHTEWRRRCREAAEADAAQRAIEARRRRDAEAAAYKASLEDLSPAEREAFIAAQIEAEQTRWAEEVREEEAKRERLERRMAREKARKALQRKVKNGGNDEAEEGETQLDSVEQMAEAVVSKYD